MPSPSVTHTFSNSTTADATQVNTNFTDIINAMTDGTKDFSISALTVAGTATLNGSVNLGNATSDDLTITASLASTLNIKTTNSFDVGTATLGLRSIYFGSGAGAFTTRVIGGAAASSITLTLPTTDGAADETLTTDGSGAMSWTGRLSMSLVVGADCKNNAGTPNTQYDLDCDAVVLRNSGGATITRFNPGAALTNNISTAGSAANGRDQSGAFTNSSWLHFYWIWDGSTLATLSSATAPPTGPTLPTNYTHWAYAGAVYLDGSGNLIKTRIKGSRAYYEQLRTIFSAGNATVETAVSLTAYIPANSLCGTYLIYVDNNTASASQSASFRVVTGSNYYLQYLGISGASVSAAVSTMVDIPNVGQNLYYLNSVSTVRTTLSIAGYKVPNGGE